jgi:DNA-binding GntR family transcriptional regulator
VGETVLLVLYDRVKAVVSAETTEVGLIMHRQLIKACRNRRPQEARAIMAQDIEILSRRFAEFSAACRSGRATRGQNEKRPAHSRVTIASRRRP